MTVKELSVADYRNIEKINITPSESVNVIYGENAQGKTNLLESIWLFTGCKSFRSKRDRELVRFDASYAKKRDDLFSQRDASSLRLFL